MFLWVFGMTGEGRDKTFNRLVSIVERLRSPGGCPWDREQTMESLRTYLIEEVYEVIEAIDHNDHEALQEELGDLLFHILFLSFLAKEQKKFDIWDVIVRISEKMVNRHPHVFGEEKVSFSTDVVKAWADLKEREKTHRRSILDGIPHHLPALLRAYRITEKVSHVGFDWEKTNDIFEKLDEEIGELKEVISLGNRTKIEEEIGDILFVLVNLARRTGNNPEDALRKTIRKFRRRFHHLERELETAHRNLKETSLEEMDRLWEEAKGNE